VRSRYFCISVCKFSLTMPHLSLKTNVKRSDVPEDLPKRLCQVVSDTLGKPYESCSVTIIPDVLRSWGGSSEPSVQATLRSIGKLGPEENIKHTKAISDTVSKALGVKVDKIGIWFLDADSHYVGNKGTTVYELRK